MDELKILGRSDGELIELSRHMLLSLDINEMRKIERYYSKLKREPAAIELETIAQTWSEHCKHKTFNAQISYSENGRKEKITSLFKTYIRKATQKARKKWLVSVFSDNAGIVKFNAKFNLAMKAETHNHPSALDPYGGANTGIGGVIRDVLGAGLGARPVANTDVFCFAPHNMPAQKVPQGIMHPKRIFKGVRSGVMDYGNRVGIPTVNGAILFDERYLGNPLVYCGTVGIIPKGMEKKAAKAGDAIVVVGARTGRDGIHGATFSSTGLDESASSSAVQIGNPIEEKKMMEAILKARDLGLYNAITDCGAGGFSSAVGEMASNTGARVFLDKAPLKYKGLAPWEIWVSESQERMVIAMPKKNFVAFREICEIEGTDATMIGEFTKSKKLELFYNNELVGELGMEFLHEGVPIKRMEAQWSPKGEREIVNFEPADLGETLLRLLAMPNIASKETTVRKYDHEVRGGTVGKPFVGPKNDGPADAAIIRPILDDWRGAVISNGINPLYSDIDPYWMACSAIDEALRNAIAVGADFERIALLDNFSWGNPENAETLGGLVRACEGCLDASKGFNAPFISGKDSLYNEFILGKEKVSIPGTLLISALGIIEDSRKKVSMPFKREGNAVFIVGETFSELGGSHYAKLSGTEKAAGKGAGRVPKVNFKKAKGIFSKISALMRSQSAEEKIIVSCHDCSEGGIAVALAEMAFAGMNGAEIFLEKIPLGEKIARNDFVLFSESNSRFIVEVEAKQKEKFLKAMKGCAAAEIGHVLSGKSLVVNGLEGKKIIGEPLDDLKRAWKKTLDW
ncbi:MAG TPA: phosphoribosylformylglycinamidine synthase subunit PurL [Candidatus Diapherotrites archaeon]|uniref:Phosphoribosylformylglycinamidine synthase subunit PurL n=1 Tax=Candidatus Iainarchaeum sp. TaxID=3101447 RepID=A0A7J4J026_9ARCH|nr:phosphoribosylformylglycinamidine synthase subunit PurL [Candidatus Diapherotrites archaeon]